MIRYGTHIIFIVNMKYIYCFYANEFRNIYIYTYSDSLSPSLFLLLFFFLLATTQAICVKMCENDLGKFSFSFCRGKSKSNAGEMLKCEGKFSMRKKALKSNEESKERVREKKLLQNEAIFLIRLTTW